MVHLFLKVPVLNITKPRNTFTSKTISRRPLHRLYHCNLTPLTPYVQIKNLKLTQGTGQKRNTTESDRSLSRLLQEEQL